MKCGKCGALEHFCINFYCLNNMLNRFRHVRHFKFFAIFYTILVLSIILWSYQYTRSVAYWASKNQGNNIPSAAESLFILPDDHLEPKFDWLEGRQKLNGFGDVPPSLPTKRSHVLFREMPENPHRNAHLFDVDLLISPPSSVCCQNQDNNFTTGRPCVSIFVLTTAENAYRRSLIRDTWGNSRWYPDITLNVFFLLGGDNSSTNVQDEADLMQDLIQGNFPDNYDRLTTKVITGLRWLNASCNTKTIDLLLKTDDDIYLNLWGILKLLDKYLAKQIPKSIFGDASVGTIPHRDADVKWSLTFAMYPYESYPQFVRGGLYGLSGDLISPLIDRAYRERYIWLEDVFLTGICMQTLNVTYYDWSRFGLIWGNPDDLAGTLKMVQSGGYLYVHIGEDHWRKALWIQLLEQHLQDSERTQFNQKAHAIHDVNKLST